eukprot:Seg2398.4 transcript_id=Seg2398.4/GoldUCD/mRNA.D3Y31 product="hypothetical protein" protein_id=Seg2398.4/GoldUCD/D3Y31
MYPEQEKLHAQPGKERSDMPQTEAIDLQAGVEKLRKLLWNTLGCPTLMKTPNVFSPAQMKQFCKQAGASDLFSQVMNSMCAPHQAEKLKTRTSLGQLPFSI